MKVQGIKPGAFEDCAAFQRGDSRIVFIIRAPMDLKPFELICPRPNPAIKKMADGRVLTDDNEPGYIEALLNWGSIRQDWIYIETLKYTEGLEWEKVKLDDPQTFKFWDEELREILVPLEYRYLTDKMIRINALSVEKLDEVRESFLVERAEALLAQNSPQEGQNST